MHSPRPLPAAVPVPWLSRGKQGPLFSLRAQLEEAHPLLQTIAPQPDTCPGTNMCALGVEAPLAHHHKARQSRELGSDIRALFPDAHTMLLCLGW